MPEKERPNPYVVTRDTIEEAPTRFLGQLKYLGPGFILSASIVGSGELIATTRLGAQAGFVTLWVVLFSCLVKVAVQLEFGKYAIYSGESTFAAFNRLPGPKLGRANWSIWSWLGLMMVKSLQLGGIVGGIVIILEMALPQAGIARPVWTLMVAVSVSALVFRGWYQPIERISLVMIGLFTILTLASVIMLQETQFAIHWSDIGSGLTFSLPAAALVAAIGAFGITGVGGDEIMMYNYWLIEKGYAAKTGPRDDSPEWNRRARGWIRVMYLDAVFAMLCYTVVTAAFYVLGAAVLNAQGLVPEKNEIVETLSQMYTTTLGEGAKTVFLIGAFVVLFSTLLSALAGWTRLYSDAFGQITTADFTDPKTRGRWIAILAWIIPLCWGVLFLTFQAPGIMVLLGGLVTAAILLIVLFATVFFRYRALPASLKPSRLYDVIFWVSAIAILMAAVYAVYSGVSAFLGQ